MYSNRLILFITGILLLLNFGAQADPELKCLVCRKVIEEIEDEIRKVDPKKKVQVGSYRLDPKGNQRRNEISYARSEIHIHEVLENLCNVMDDYAQAKYKETGERTILKLMVNGNMNPDMSKVDMTPDPDLNKMLKYYCENIIEDFEDDIIRVFTKNLPDPDVKICTTAADICQDNPSEDDYTFEDKDEL